MITYSIRKSARTKRLQLKINRLAQVEVVSPLVVGKNEIETFVQSHTSWIEKHKNKILSRLDKHENLSASPPDTIFISLLAKTYQVEYFSPAKKARFLIEADVLQIYANTDDEKKTALQAFVHSIAKEELTILLNETSENYALPYNKVFIKSQKTRWGSCSSKKNINLNRNMIFLRPCQVEYLLLHELCHTVHLNHSSRYWQLVSQFMPDYKTRDTSLRNATLDVPLWALS